MFFASCNIIVFYAFKFRWNILLTLLYEVLLLVTAIIHFCCKIDMRKGSRTDVYRNKTRWFCVLKINTWCNNPFIEDWVIMRVSVMCISSSHSNSFFQSRALSEIQKKVVLDEINHKKFMSDRHCNCIHCLQFFQVQVLLISILKIIINCIQNTILLRRTVISVIAIL